MCGVVELKHKTHVMVSVNNVANVMKMEYANSWFYCGKRWN